jgi:hypothetical protein
MKIIIFVKANAFGDFHKTIPSVALTNLNYEADCKKFGKIYRDDRINRDFFKKLNLPLSLSILSSL